MSEKVFLALVGGRSATPTIMGALQFLEEFEKIKFLLCEHPNSLYQTFAENTVRMLKAKKKSLVFDKENDMRTVNGNDFILVSEAVRELCDENDELKFVNVSSAPQEMAFSVYNYILNNNVKALVFNVNTNTSQLTPLIHDVEKIMRDIAPIQLNKKLTVEDYALACEIKIFKKKFDIGEFSCSEAEAKKVVDYFIDNIEISNKILSVMRRGERVRVPNSLSIGEGDLANKEISTEEFIGFLDLLKENRIISGYKYNNKTYFFRIEKQSDYAFLYGDWLEYFVYLEGKEIGFDSIEMSVELSDYKGEIDVFCVHNANALICECKTGRYDTYDLDRLRRKADQLGGNYCVRLFITTDQVEENFRNQASNGKIVVVSINELKNIREILKKQMDNPEFPRY